MFPSAVLVVATIAIGYGATFWTSVPLRFEERLPIAVVTGVVLVTVASFVGFQLFGMGPAALGVGLVVPGALAVAGWRTDPARGAREARRSWRLLQRPARQAGSLRPLAVLTVVSTAVATRILALAYQHEDGRLRVGHLSGYGDWAAHLAYTGSFAYGDNRALETPLAVGTPLRYHFFANFHASTFTVTGLQLQQALVWSSWLVAITIAPLMYGFVRRLALPRATAIGSVVLFGLAGGLGSWYFVQDVRTEGLGIWSAIPRTYARMPEQGIWLDNTIGASFYAQRSTLFGVAIGLAAGIVLLAARPSWNRRGFAFAGALVGITGIAHVHLLFSALALTGLAMLADRRLRWAWFLVPASVIGLPLAWAIRPPTSAMRWLPGWMAEQSDQTWAWFWMRNGGLLAVLWLGAAIFGAVPRRLLRLSAPLWLWFVVPNLVSFHPWEGNNTKFFLFWQFAAAIVVAELLRRWASRRWLLLVAVAMAVLLTSSGGLDTVRSMQRSSAFDWVDDDDWAAGAWLRGRAGEGDVLVYGATNTSGIAAFSGVPAVSGYAGWTDDLGIPDALQRSADSQRILQGSPDAMDLVARYSVDWVAIGPIERLGSGASDAFWDDHGELAFERGGYRIYEVTS